MDFSPSTIIQIFSDIRCDINHNKVAKYVPGQSYQFYAKVTGTGLTPATSTWTISGNSSDDTFISPQGLLYFSKDETGATITVTATNNFNSEVSGTASVTKV